MNTIQKFEVKQLEKLGENKTIPEFGPGDTVKVNVKVKEGTRERIQAYEGICISRKGSGLNENFTVRKISYGEGVERVFPLWSSRIDSIELVRSGSVRRAKLYYLRDRRGKSARISERTTGYGMDTAIEEGAEATMTKTEKANAKKQAKKEAKEARAKNPPAPKKKKSEEAAPEGQATE